MQYDTRIAALRDKSGFTQEELADLLGISRASLSHYEKNRRKPDFQTLTRLADFFKVTIDYLIGRPPQWFFQTEIREFVDLDQLDNEEMFRLFDLRWDGHLLTEAETKKMIDLALQSRVLQQ